MQNKKILIFCIIGFLFVSIMGALSHFFYKWSSYNKIIGILFPANESAWEHLKLAIFPTIIYFLFGKIFIKNTNYLFALFLTLLIPILVIPILFYTYTAIIGHEILFVDISIFLISVCFAFFMCWLILLLNPLNKNYNVIAIIGLIIILTSYFTFTIYPPNFFIFKDFTNNTYGLK